MAFLTAEQATTLLKKLLGKPSTNVNNEFFQEPSRPARAAVFQTQIWSEEVPATAPADLASVTTDDGGHPIEGSLLGRTSSSNPMVRKYVKVPLTVVAGSENAAYECAADATYGRVLQDTIPFNYDDGGSYVYQLYKYDGATAIPFGLGSWLLDTEAGVLTFWEYSQVSSFVTSTGAPKITFYRYVGGRGIASASQNAAAIETQSLTFQEPITFQGGDSGVITDALAAIVLDDRDLAALPLDTPAMALQLGADADGSWRVCSFGGGGSAAATSLAIQVRVGGTWVTKSSYSPE
ncbi:hypothetical protein JKP88DRAFT_273098 [Tribonema minus]|uniref:Uncharacterized protein n=1 Tax=Tribonema minus TaxID=303371 RepID=A0A835YX86_9STRA|nr:hypothetical protein JKP88DRAFT_273098 [Tribonema minus]